MLDPSESEREFEDQKAIAAKCYTPEFILSLARNFGIDDAVQIDRLRDGLALAAWVYVYRPDHTDRIKTGPVREELKEIAHLADRLDSKLDAISNAASEMLWLGQRQVEANLPWTDANVSPRGHTIVRWEYPSGAKSVTVLREGQIREAVRIVRNLAQESLARARVDKGGRPHNDSLLLWVFNVQKIWEDILGYEFTFHEYEGQPKGRAFEFCRAAIRPLAPAVTDAALTTAIRKAISRKPKEPQLKQEPPSN
jgi:hypothetical protein